jgi:type IX secretion system PorP/SprF family membrane protein
MKKIVFIITALAFNFSLSAQQISLYSQYYWNDYVINPAFTGIKNTPRIQMGYRNQWSGFRGAPKTYSIGGHTNLKNTNMGLGGMLFSDDQGGAIKQNGVMLNYSYNLKLNRESGLSFGISGILNQYSYDGTGIENINPDPTLQSNVKQVAPDMNFGLVYHLKNKLFIGLAANQLISSRLNKLNSVPLITTGNKLIRHYNLSASYLAKVNTNISLEPYAMLRTTFITSPQVELGAKVTYNDFVFGGLSYRNKDAVIGLIGLNYKQFMLAYTYDFTTSGIRNYSSGSHEILLAYQFNKKTKTPEVIIEQPKDSDGDGVSDNEDLCPNVKGLREYKGCPDSDGDGVFDDLDECKTVKGPKENKGCPWPDSDNDGLSDNKDECPTISGPVENRGCPYGDTDGDGVNDNVDPCPKTAGPVENKGCPIIEKKDQEVIDMAVKNLEFETSKDIIEESSKPSLNTLADKLKQKGEWNLLLSGHTDNVGDDDANMILSKNRAEAVKNYFISQGIAENRIKVNYFGETKPIADNSTSDGRQKNRRVEFVIVFE